MSRVPDGAGVQRGRDPQLLMQTGPALEPQRHVCSDQPVQLAPKRTTVSVLQHQPAWDLRMLVPSLAGAVQTARPQGQSHLGPELQSCWGLLGCHCPLGPCPRPGPSRPGAASRATTSDPPARRILRHRLDAASHAVRSRPLAQRQRSPDSQLRSIGATGSSPLDEKHCKTTKGFCSISCHQEQQLCTAAMLLFWCTPFLRQVGLSLHETGYVYCLSKHLSLGRPGCLCIQLRIQLRIPHCVDTVQHCLALQHDTCLSHWLPDSQAIASLLDRPWQHQAHSWPEVCPGTRSPAGSPHPPVTSELPSSQATNFPAG